MGIYIAASQAGIQYPTRADRVGEGKGVGISSVLLLCVPRQHAGDVDMSRKVQRH